MKKDNTLLELVTGIILVGVVVTILNGVITLIQKKFVKWKMVG